MKKTAEFRASPLLQESLRRRRSAFLDALEGGIAVVSASAPVASPDGDRILYHANSSFYYLTGFDDSDAVAVFVPGHPTEKAILFLREKDRNVELWHGPMLGIQGAREQLCFDAAYSLEKLESKLKEYLEHANSIFWSAHSLQPLHGMLNEALLGSRLRRNGAEVFDPEPLLSELRLKKDSYEIQQLKSANVIASAAHEAAMLRAIHRGTRNLPESQGSPLFEFQVQATLEAAMKEHGVRHLGYPSIVASGENACCLHYSLNNSALEKGDMMLIDAGCEWMGYTSDITRTWPVDGIFTAPQKELYQLVLKAQKKAIEAIKPGVLMSKLTDISLEVMIEGLVSLGLLKGTVAEIREQKKDKDFIPHSLGHWLGLDVHDVGRYRIKNEERPLEAGMCLTIEPGIYVQPYLENIDARWRGIGIRIEDNILVTAQGFENLTPCIKEIHDLEALRS